MKRLKFFTVTLTTLVFALCGAAGADDGEMNNKSMSKTIKVPAFEQEAVNEKLPEAEHAFAGFMKFYVPAQAASGAPAGDDENGLITYNDIDENLVEELEVAKPLINVFIYGPQFEVENTAFAHRWFDTYAAVSLDDGVTFKKTNLSESADKSSFNLSTDTGSSDGDGPGDPLPDFHTIPYEAFWGAEYLHAPGLFEPFSSPNHCSECHGVALQGTTKAPACYGCHDAKWDEETPDELGPVIAHAEWIEEDKTLEINGVNAAADTVVSIQNAITEHVVGTADSDALGDFSSDLVLEEELPPCVLSAKTTDNNGEVQVGPAVTVTDPKTHEALEACVRGGIDVNEYPGGSYNVFRAIAGNKVLVAWPSRFCEQGQPAYSMTTDAGLEDPDQQARLTAITDFLVAGDTDLGVSPLPNFTMEDDLYLLDAFGVAGKQGSVDFADEGYPQAGIVPFGCVWTARGIMLPGDDPRTDEEETSHMVWTKAERLTSGRRDPNRIEVQAVQDAGFVITWQEDPEGLRPGQGLGPGEGWSGAVAHSQTDVWYSFINYEYFDIVEDTETSTEYKNVIDHDLTESGRPQVFVPMAVPMRMTNNAKCNVPVDGEEYKDDLYCNYELAEPYGIKNQCADQIIVTIGNPDSQQGVKEVPICVVDSDGDGTADLPNRANTAATRPRLSLQGYDASTDDKSAWVIFAVEESKGLGAYFFEPDSDGDGYAELCAEGDELPCTEELGKNQWYHSFDMGTPDTSAGIDKKYSLVENLVSQGNMLNQGEVHWESGEMFGLMSTSVMGVNGASLYGEDYDFEILNTEIARRASLLVQGISKAQNSQSHLLATPSWKQGPMRQGGPADTMMRRIVWDCDTGDNASFSFAATSVLAVNEDEDGRQNDDVEICHKGKVIVVDEDALDGHFGHGDKLGSCDDYCEIPQTIDVNPYAFENMVCEEFLIQPDTNPYYPGGVCADPAINLSGVVPDSCLDDDTGGDVPCPTVDFSGSTYGIGDTNPILQGVVQGEGNKTRVLTWHQCPSDSTVLSSDGVTPVDCASDDRDDIFVNLRDQSWYNPLDVSKGHRGFLDGDFVMFLYAWSPNWRLNAKGHDRYELYVRRSFDGGETWTTTPSSVQGSDGELYTADGTVTCESYRSDETGSGEPNEPKACFEFSAGAAEHARNVTQHKSMKITTLDPRYAITGSPRGVGIDEDACTDGLFVDNTVIDGIFTCDDLSEVQDTDKRNPSRFFMVFETGDNNTVAVGEAEPLDLNYSRAENFGDDYVVWTETDTDSANPGECYPSDPHDVDVPDAIIGSGFCNEFDRLNTRGDTHSSEASLAGNSDGSKMYAVWAQWIFADDDDYESEIVDSEAKARRVWWLDDYISVENAYTLPGTQTDSP